MKDNIKQVLIQSTLGISTYKEGMTNLIVNIDEVIENISKLIIDNHDHSWNLGRFFFVNKGSMVNPKGYDAATFVCECGAFKTVESKR